MKNKTMQTLMISLGVILLVAGYAFSSTMDVDDRLEVVLDGNMVKTLNFNSGTLGKTMIAPSFEWPMGSGKEYAFEFGLLVGSKISRNEQEPIYFFTDGMSVGGVNNGSEGAGENEWQPVAGYSAGDPNTSVARNDDGSTWPVSWTSWPSIATSFSTGANLETYYVMNDKYNARHEDEYTAIASDTTYLGAGIEVGVWTYQWDTSDLENALLVAYDIKNISDLAMDSVVVGMRGDLKIGGFMDYRDDNVGYIDAEGFDTFTGLTYTSMSNLIYCWDTDRVGDDSFGTDSVGFFGIHLLQHNPTDYFKSLRVPPYRNDSDNESVWWSRFVSSIDTSTFTQDADNMLEYGTDFFSLGVGESKIILVAYVFGNSFDELVENAQAIDTKYEETFGTMVGIDLNDEILVPSKIQITNAYPNPFNSSISISYFLDENTRVDLSIYDITGRLVKNLIHEEQSSGSKSINWDGRGNAGYDLDSGMYFLHISSGGDHQSEKILLLK